MRAGLRELVVTDALLRMYCAVLDEDRGGAGSVWPPHPGLPGRTRALPLRETGPHSVWQATEYLMRPLAIVARVAGEHGVVLDLDPARFRIEVDRDDRPTGRVVVELLPDAEGDASLPDWLLTRCVDRVAERCFTGGQEARAWLREVAEHELAVGPAFRRELNTASNTRSIAQIRLSDLSSRPTAKSHGVWLTAAQTKRLLYRTDGSVPPALAVARAAVLRAAWEAAIGYAAVLRTDRDLAYDAMFGAHISLTALTPGPGRCGFAGLGGSGLLPWHGTAAVDRRGVLSTDFAISLLDRAFVPVYAAVLGGADQPWFMAPITAIEVAGSAGPGSGPARLSDAFLDTVRLRTH